MIDETNKLLSAFSPFLTSYIVCCQYIISFEYLYVVNSEKKLARTSGNFVNKRGSKEVAGGAGRGRSGALVFVGR